MRTNCLRTFATFVFSWLEKQRVVSDRIFAKVSFVLEGNDRRATFLAAIESRVYYFLVKGKKVSGRPDTLIVPVENKANREKKQRRGAFLGERDNE